MGQAPQVIVREGRVRESEGWRERERGGTSSSGVWKLVLRSLGARIEESGSSS